MLKYKIPQIVTLIPLDNARSERAQKKIPLRNNLRGIIEVPGGFEPPYTVLQTAD
jgi:hypothetical protein